MQEIKRAGGYIRVSTAEQSTKGLSIETQIAEIKAYAKMHGMKLEDMYIDRGITARKSLEKRTDFMRMMEDVKSGKIKHIIVLRLDRFFRNVYDYHKMMNEYLSPNKCDWSAVKEQYTTTTTNGRLMINLRLSIAEQECDTDSDRIKDVFDNRIKNGFAITNSVPFGFKVENKRVVIDEEKRAIMEDMFNYVESCSSVRRTMKYMINTYGVYLSYKALSKIFKNPLLYGTYRDNENYCEPYMSKERFDNIRRLLDKNVKVRSNDRVYIFSGLLRCSECNLRLGATHIAGYKYYRCTKYLSERRCTNSKNINEVFIENYLVENVEELVRQYIFQVEKTEEKAKPAKSNKKIIEKKLQKLNDLYVNDFIDMDAYKKEYALLQSQIIDVPETPKKDLTTLKNFLNKDFKSFYSTLSIIEKQAFWRGIIKEIKVREKVIEDVVFL